MPRTDVIQYQVQDQSQAARSHLAGQPAKLLVAAEARIDGIEVGNRIALVRPHRDRVLEHGVQGHGRKPHVCDVVEPGGDACEVTAVASVRLAAVRFVGKKFEFVVTGVGIRETVWCNQVDRVSRRYAAAVIGVPWPQLVGMRQRVVALPEYDVECAWLGTRRDVEVQKQEVRALDADDAIDCDVGTVDRRCQKRDVVAEYQ